MDRSATNSPVAFRAVLFDWGDTLFYSPSGARVIVEAARQRGITVEEAAAAELWDELWAAGKSPEELAKGRDLSPQAHRAVWTALFSRGDALVPGLGKTLYERVMMPEQWMPYPDTPAMLRALKRRRVRVGVVSNVALEIEPAFARHGLQDLVDAFVLSFEHGAVKPSPILFREACRALGVRPEETLMVGDHPFTDGGAVNAGLAVFLLPPAAPARGPRGLERILPLFSAARSHAPGRAHA